MFEWMISISNAIASVVFLWWVYLPLAVSVWLMTLFCVLRTCPPHREIYEAGIFGSLAGFALGLSAPPILALSPFLLPIVLIVGGIILVGTGVAHLMWGKK